MPTQAPVNVSAPTLDPCQTNLQTSAIHYQLVFKTSQHFFLFSARNNASDTSVLLFKKGSSTPLSIFGSLGIVKAVSAALLATITYPFDGSHWLDDAGFATPGSVSSMVTIAQDTGLYGAEAALRQLLDEQHIEPKLVKGLDWSGWKSDSGPNNAVDETWIGAIRLALQLRIHRITKLSLAWMRIQMDHQQDREDGNVADKEQPVIPRLTLSPTEKQELTTLLEIDPFLVLYQLVMAIEMRMIVTGYVSRFSLVSQTNVNGGPYVWFGLETALSILRICLWGSNPGRDEKTGLEVSLELKEMDPSFPLIFSPFGGKQLGLEDDTQSESFMRQNGLDSNNIVTLFYNVLVQLQEKHLYITVLFLDSRPPLAFSVRDDGGEFPVFSCELKVIPYTRALHITLGKPIVKTIDTFFRSLPFCEIVQHASTLRTRLFSGKQYDGLNVGWNLIMLSLVEKTQNDPVDPKPLTNQLEISRIEFRPGPFHAEVLIIVESLVLELQWWYQETRLAVHIL
ncbi:hypothetical protein WG66_010830 [Moniliophthora roreri]|nr:hypothetical protein WG66_010830 [Moniliophthora roreri]